MRCARKSRSAIPRITMGAIATISRSTTRLPRERFGVPSTKWRADAIMPTNPPDSPDAARSTPVEAPPSEPYFGCFTGDCPHTKHSECDAAIREHCAELERENAVLSGRASERAPDDILATFRRYAEAASEYADCLKRAYMGDFRSVAEDRDLDDAVRELREVRTEFVAELTHLRAERDTLRRFCGVALQATR